MTPEQQARDRLGAFVKRQVSLNKYGCEVQRSALEEIGLPINSMEYADWLTKNGLRMLRPTLHTVCFVLAPEMPADLKATGEKWVAGLGE